MNKSTTRLFFCLATSVIFAWGTLLGQNKSDRQTFTAQAIVGLNAGQIDGDFEVGYNKLGFSGGVGIGINISKRFYVGTEFLFSQRGSKDGFFRQDGVEAGSISISYIELPIIVRLLDWYQEDEGYNKVWLEGGVSPARLIIADLKGSANPDLVDEFKTTDLSWILGAGYSMTKNFSFGLRYTRSIYPFYVAIDPEPLDAKSLLSYFLTLRVSYTI